MNKTKNVISRVYEQNIKPELIKSKNRVANDVRDRYNDGYNRIKSSIRDAYDGPRMSPMDMQDDSSEYDDVPEVGAGMKRKRGGKSKTARGALISKLMKQHGMSLGQASHHIKSHNLM